MMENTIDNQQLTSIVSIFFNIESSELGDSDDLFTIRFRGYLINPDTEKGFENLLDELKKFNLLAAIQPSMGKHDLLIFPITSKRIKPKPTLNAVMFLLTLISVLITGGLYAIEGNLPENLFQSLYLLIRSGWPFGLSLLGILAAHELGHYIAGKIHGVDVTLPMFIPFPLSTFGTLGAFISMRSIPRNNKELFDIAFTGPLSGLIVSIIVLFIGMNLSDLDTIPASTDIINGIQLEGNSLLYLLIKYISFGKLLPQPQNLSSIQLLIFWIRFFFTGIPFPWGAQDVMLHPVAWAGWAGLFVTTINLIPVGQLDGGHIIHSVFGPKVLRFIYPLILVILVVFGFFWSGWWTWAAILFFFGQRTAPPLDQISALDKKRRILGVLMIIIFLITFIPVPITIAVL